MFKVVFSNLLRTPGRSLNKNSWEESEHHSPLSLDGMQVIPLGALAGTTLEEFR